MIQLTCIEVEGRTEQSEFRGELKLGPGLNIFSQENAYGKSLALTAVPWCLGIETIFGLQDCDASRFPSAVRDVISLGDQPSAEVVSSEARITFKRDDGAVVALRRSIKGGDLGLVEVLESGEGEPRRSLLQARRRTMADEAGGLQRFLYEWMGIPRAPLMTFRGVEAEIYLENLAPLFYIDQNEGWTDLQALQVYRYQLQAVGEAAVEHLLGARVALRSRFEEQRDVSIEERLKGEAQKLSERIVEFFAARGWPLRWSAHGSPGDIATRWASQPLSRVARDQFNMDPTAERRRLDERIKALRNALVEDGRGTAQMAAASQASQEVVELKTRRHELRDALRAARMQLADQSAIVETIEHRTHSSMDVLRLKTQGIGRLDLVECPTCHRQLDPTTFQLVDQSKDSVQAHVDALQKQRALLLSNIAALENELVHLQHENGVVDERLLAADRGLVTVNQAVGSTRERLAKTATDLAAAERELDKLLAYERDVAELERDIGRWIQEVHAAEVPTVDSSDLAERIRTFQEKLRAQLLALGHSAITKENAAGVRFDDRYVPYLGPRRIRSLGSASDHARLVAAYVLALAEASRAQTGAHPGFVVLDEPLQQNPDQKHVELMLQFFETAARETTIQVIVTTYLNPAQLSRLQAAGVNAIELPGTHFLEKRSSDVPSR